MIIDNYRLTYSRPEEFISQAESFISCAIIRIELYIQISAFTQYSWYQTRTTECSQCWCIPIRTVEYGQMVIFTAMENEIQL